MASDKQYWADQFNKHGHTAAGQLGMSNMFGTPEPFHLHPHHHSREAEKEHIVQNEKIKLAKHVLKRLHTLRRRQ